MRYVAIPGTWGWRDRDDDRAWFREGSPFDREARRAGLYPLRPYPFLWTTRVNGIEWWRRWLAVVLPERWETGDHVDWQAGAHALRTYCEAEDFCADVMIAHSHGGQVLAYAVAAGWIRPQLIVTVSTPPRRDMRRLYVNARMGLDRHGGRWRHVYATGGDWWQRLGVSGDGGLNFGGVGPMPAAHENYPLDGAGHTRALNDAEFTRLHLVDRGYLTL